MNTKDREALEAELKKDLSNRSTQQGVVRSLATRISAILEEDDAGKVKNAEDMCRNLKDQMQKHDKIMIGIRVSADTLSKDITVEEDKAKKLHDEIVVVQKSAIDWIKKVKKDRPTPTADTETVTGAGALTPEQAKLKESELVRALKEQVDQMSTTAGELDDAIFEIGTLKRQITDQGSSHQQTVLSLEEQVSELKEEMDKMQRARHDAERDLSEEKSRRESAEGDLTRMRSVGRESMFLPSSDSTRVTTDADNEMRSFSEIFAKTNAEVIRQVMEQSTVQHKSFCSTLQTPKIELKEFTGNYTEYHSFISRFEDLVGDTDASDALKLNTLIQYCSTDVKKHLECCNYKPANQGLALARQILKEKFGNAFLVSQAWIDKIIQYPLLKDPEEIQLYASELRSCQQSLTSLGYLSDLENTSNMRVIISKVPVFIQNRWRKSNRELLKQNRKATIKDILKTVTEAAEEMSDPIFGTASMQKLYSPQETAQDKKSNKRKTVFGLTQAETKSADQGNKRYSGATGDSRQGTRKVQCIFCKDEHFPRKCPEYTSLSAKDRLHLVYERKLCLLCLNPFHFAKDCTMRWTCQVPGCRAKHNTSLHDAFVGDDRKTSSQGRDKVDTDRSDKASDKTPALNTVSKDSYSLPVLPVHIEGRSGVHETNVLIDTGASMTFITKRFFDKLKIRNYSEEHINMTTMTGAQEMKVKVINFSIKAVDSSVWKPVYNVAVVDGLPVGASYVTRITKTKDWPHLEEIGMPLPNTDTVDVLIGQSNARLFKEERRVDGPQEDNPYAVRTVIGWTIMGHFLKASDSVCTVKAKTVKAKKRKVDAEVLSCQLTTELGDDVGSLAKKLDLLWKSEEVPEVEHKDPMEVKVLKCWEEGTFFKDGHVHVPIPVRNDPPNMPDNFAVVKKRFDALTRRLDRNPDLKEQYCKSMRSNFDQGFAEVCDKPARDGYCWFHPQQAVISDRRPNKCRVVGDLSIVYQGKCLNEEVYQGPNYTANLIDILVGFRLYKIGITGDIKEMFNQVRVPEGQRDLMRFLWWRDHVLNGEVEECRMCTEVFGGIWSPAASMYAMRWVAGHLGDEYDEEVIKTIMRHFYVDDMIRSIWDTEVGIALVRDVRELLGKGGFDLIKLGSSDKEILESIPPEFRAKDCQELDLFMKDGVVTHTLGSVWRPLKDILAYRAIVLTKPFTRRGVLSTTSSLYDPLGLIAPFILKAKILLQKICKEKLDWDQEIPAIYNKEWTTWLGDVPVIQEFSVTRWVGVEPGVKQSCTLNVFTDASEVGYGAAVYLVVKNAHGEVTASNLLMSKAKVTPMSTMTIPRLELNAAVLGIKLERAMRKALEVDLLDTIFWTDSMIVLWYVRGQSWRFKTFVANRITYIQEKCDPEQWNYVPTDINPADCLSRGLGATELLEKSEWKFGPDFLRDSTLLPEQPELKVTKDLLEVKKTAVCLSVQVKVLTSSVKRTLLDHFSQWNKLVRCVCVWKRILKFVKTRKYATVSFTVSEVQEAELFCFRMIQDEYISSEQRKSKIFRKLFPLDDFGLLRVGGRLMLSGLTYDVIHPPILPDCCATRMLVKHIHDRLGHPGVDRTYCEVKQKVWVLGGKKTVKISISGCVYCKRIRGKVGVQVMSPLPVDRVSKGTVPFDAVGIDYCGPFYVKVGRSLVKRYVCTIICMQSKAVHFEVSYDMSTSSFLQAMQRFVSRRGRPRVIYCDNGTNFVGAKRELKEMLKQYNQRYIGNVMAEQGIEWHFNVPLASHHGGLWERMNRSFRTTMMGLSSGQTLSDEGLLTLVASVEQVLNSRPLTSVGEDPEDFEALTPSHLLNLRKAKGFPGDYAKADTYKGKWKQMQYLSDVFWRRWTRVYLQGLQARQKWVDPKPDLRVEELVLVLDESLPRLEWPLGRVLQVFRGRDDRVRSALVRTAAGKYKRPITKIIRLEIDQ